MSNVLGPVWRVDAELQLWGAVLQVHAAQKVLLQFLCSRAAIFETLMEKVLNKENLKKKNPKQP